MSKHSLIEQYEDLLSHLNAEENGKALEFWRDLLSFIEGSEEDELWIQCLRAAGVDNWDGYDYAMEMYHEQV